MGRIQTSHAITVPPTTLDSTICTMIPAGVTGSGPGSGGSWTITTSTCTTTYNPGFYTMLPGSLVIPLGTTLTVAGDAHLILEANQILTNHGTLNLESPATIPHSGAEPWFSVTIFLGGEVDNYGVMNIIQTSPHDGGGLETITSGSDQQRDRRCHQ